MARLVTGASFGLNIKQAQAARLLAEGNGTKEIAKILFDCTRADNPMLEDPRKVRNGMDKVRKWMHDPNFQEAYRAIVKEAVMPDYARAVGVLSKQLNEQNGWLANKAANDILTRFGPIIMGEEDKAVTVRIEGMPTIGTPESQEELPDAIEVDGNVH